MVEQKIVVERCWYWVRSISWFLHLIYCDSKHVKWTVKELTIKVIFIVPKCAFHISTILLNWTISRIGLVFEKSKIFISLTIKSKTYRRLSILSIAISIKYEHITIYCCWSYIHCCCYWCCKLYYSLLSCIRIAYVRYFFFVDFLWNGHTAGIAIS